MKNICYIIGALNVHDIVIKPHNNDFIIAADGGYTSLEKLSVKADLVIGDFDSIKKVPENENMVRYPVEKDDTDMMLAVNEGLKRGYKTFVIYGGLGGRLDHTYANIELLAYLASNNATGYLLGEGMAITAIMNGKVHFDKQNDGIISIFCSGNEAKGVNLSGLKYELKNAVISCNIPLGISNEFISKDSIVTVEDGTLIIMWNKKPYDLLKVLYEDTE